MRKKKEEYDGKKWTVKRREGKEWMSEIWNEGKGGYDEESRMR